MNVAEKPSPEQTNALMQKTTNGTSHNETEAANEPLFILLKGEIREEHQQKFSFITETVTIPRFQWKYH